MPQPVSGLTNRTVALTAMFPRADEPRLRELAAAADGPAVMEVLEALLRQAAPPADPQLDEVARMTDRIATDSTILAVEHAARLFGTSPRSLQRVFRTYVGVGPKWIIRLYRSRKPPPELKRETSAGGSISP